MIELKYEVGISSSIRFCWTGFPEIKSAIRINQNIFSLSLPSSRFLFFILVSTLDRFGERDVLSEGANRHSEVQLMLDTGCSSLTPYSFIDL